MNRELKTAPQAGTEQPSESPSARAGTAQDTILLPTGNRAAGGAVTEALRDLEDVAAVVERELARSAQEASSEDTEQSDAESLESYLGRFMERMTGKKPGEAASTNTETIPLPPSVTEVMEFQPREPSPPPERREQLTALRELANQNARNAVILHSCRSLRGKARLVFVAAAGLSLISSGLAAVTLVQPSSGAQVASFFTCGLALILSCGFFGLCRRLGQRAAAIQGAGE
jgi:hypothetical protein